MVRHCRSEGGWSPVDEIGFGPKRERRPPSRRLRTLGAAGSIAAAAAAAIAIAVTASAHHGAASPVPAAVPVPALQPLSAVCPPVQPTWPDLGALPASLRPGALKVVVDGQFSGRCPAP
jgi:hypothetical protein